MIDISNSDDIIDVREVIERVEELRSERGDFVIGTPEGDELPDPAQWARDNPDEHIELALLEELLDDLKGYGGDHQWEGDWYPATLIRDSYFKTYAQEFADDIGAIHSHASWPYNCVDWKKAAAELQQNYSSVEFDGTTYWYQ